MSKREILFRGKHIHMFPGNKKFDGIWVYGYLSDENYINSSELEGELLVDPETVCQYTGLIDKNGNKIFEEDILSAHLDDQHPEDITYVQITWNGFSWCMRESTEDEVMSEFDCNIFEVCGNIYDNPELLN